MKVLFGISNINTVKGIVDLYEKKYGEKIEYKIAYYFGQFSKEIEKDDYDRAVLKEDLEQISTKNYAEADKQIFEFIDKITNNFEARNLIFLASERRTLGDSFLSRLFGLGVYTTLTGSDRTLGKVCAALKNPMSKKEARKYYDNAATMDDIYNTSQVDENEIRRIISFYRNLNGDTSKYCEIFDRITPQYTVEQMQVIIPYLPEDVRNFLQANSQSYRSIVESSDSKVGELGKPQNNSMVSDAKNNGGVEIQKGNDIVNKILVNGNEIKNKVVQTAQGVANQVQSTVAEKAKEIKENKENKENNPEESKQGNILNKIQEAIPVKVTVEDVEQPTKVEEKPEEKVEQKVEEKVEPKVEPTPQPQPQVQQAPQQPAPQPQVITKEVIKEVPVEKEVIKEVVKEVPVEKEVIKEVVKEVPVEKEKVITQVVEKEVVKQYFDVPKDYKKTVVFVGAPKTGTTFCINAIGTYLAKQKVKVAMVDMTRKRDLYTIYTYDNTGKRNIAGESMRYASAGKNEPLVYDKLSIYTAVPGEDRKAYNPNVLVDTVARNNNIVLIDADFSTPLDYFRLSNEIYIVQDMNVLNIQQLTMFLRELKQRGIGMDKIKVVINKFVDCSLTSKDIIDIMATYTSYDLKMYDELFNPKRIQYFILPFDVDNYTKYIEMVFKYSNKFSSFTPNFQQNLNQIINSIYPTRGKVSVEEKHYTEEDDRRNKGGFGLFKKK